MPLRIRRLATLLLTALTLSSAAVAIEPAGRSNADEATRLLDRATDYVVNIKEGEYSYAYMQFYWRRSLANVERVLRVYPRTSAGRRLLNKEAQLGEFPVDYFKERVLPRLEMKRQGAVDAVNCSIFLYNLDPKRWDESRVQTMESLLTILCRQQRWNEAFIFPVRDEDRPRRLTALFKVAARYDQKVILERLLKEAGVQEKQALWPILAEAWVYLGKPRTDIAKLVQDHPEDAVRLAVLDATITREILLTRALAAKKDIAKGLGTTHFSLLNVDVRDDVEGVAHTLFPKVPEAIEARLTAYQAALGKRPSRGAPLESHIAYISNLSTTGRAAEIASYVEDARVDRKDRLALAMSAAEWIARSGEFFEATTYAAAIAKDHPELSDAITASRFRGQMEAASPNLTMRSGTLAELNIQDPCLLARLIVDWSLTPNREIRGAAPWDLVVYKYLPGFENLPLPESKEVGRASAELKPF